jgi:hypothetical protein
MSNLLSHSSPSLSQGGQRAPGAGFEPTRPETGHGLTCPSDFLSELKAYASILFLKESNPRNSPLCLRAPSSKWRTPAIFFPGERYGGNASDFCFKHFSILTAFVFKDKDKCEYRLVLGQLQLGSRRNRVSLPRAHH